MFFFISQVASFLIMPFSICLGMLVSGLVFIRRDWGKQLIMGGTALLLFFSNSYVSNRLMHAWEPEPRQFEGLPEYDVGIVLTGVTLIDKLPKDRTFFNKGADRVTHTIQLYKMGKLKKILISGGLGFSPIHPKSEAASLAEFMIWAGVKKSDLILETEAKNTRENALFSHRTLQENGYEDFPSTKILLITSAFHMKRAKACFVKTGLCPDTFPTDYYSSSPNLTSKSLIEPSIHSISIWHVLVKEWVGLLAYQMAGYI
ncbi:Uncharacterized SAM-binding protein YcdF, DUF218 family [Cyclobacterium xiamenense]|uniref:Uncharacterized SAM-binding protein YcdF, DUF218 family n=1 Tax=Cyclobacterium xiamenense TaxID=1297121 RepID=A0A1H7B9V1_9BACT|nr:YdcF family protein [Cyclobacterium xiamenense]SEJ71262.1 Uncharacterized SAM-binding protein YcdF, DUF218 family [Cyclobacterium xiamenense]